ncbi:MAG: hypothetical protein R3E96_17165 [Planctomycetota bacterium]
MGAAAVAVCGLAVVLLFKAYASDVPTSRGAARNGEVELLHLFGVWLPTGQVRNPAARGYGGAVWQPVVAAGFLLLGVVGAGLAAQRKRWLWLALWLCAATLAIPLGLWALAGPWLSQYVHRTQHPREPARASSLHPVGLAPGALRSLTGRP